MLISKYILFAQRKVHDVCSGEKWLQVLRQAICMLLGGTSRLNQRDTKMEKKKKIVPRFTV